MTEHSETTGTAKYIAGEVQRFDQKNEMFKRPRWDPAMAEVAKKIFGYVYPQDKYGHTLKDIAFKNAAWHIETGFAHGNVTQNTRMYTWDQKLVGVSRVPEGLKEEVKDPAQMSKDIKKVATTFGASLVGICEVDQRWVYSHSFHFATKEHTKLELPQECNHAVVMAFEMPFDLCQTSPTLLAEVAEGWAYSFMAYTATMVAQFIRGLGYRAIPSGNDTAIDIPLAIDAGLGELGRNGLLITEKYGPRVRISKVFTDLPLVPDEPVDFGVTRFCLACEKCAKHCPSQAILYGDRITETHNISNAGGELKWPINAEKCLGFWSRNEGSCMNCIRVCPFNKPRGSFHNLVRWLVKHFPWFDSLLVSMDNLAGYGKQVKLQFWSE